MKSKRGIFFVALTALLAIALSSGMAISISDKAAAEQGQWSNVTIASQYTLGTKLEIPEQSITVDGTTVKASSVLTYPDGRATSATVVTLDKTGAYKLCYNALVNGKPYQKRYEFTVENKLVVVGNSDSSVRYGKWVPNDPYEYNKKEITKSGLMVRLAQGDTLSFSKLIDLSNTTKDDIFFEMFATPDTLGTADFRRVVLTLTDALDPSVYLRITARDYYSEIRFSGTSYVLAGANGQSMKGYHESTGNLYVESVWGTGAPHSFYGMDNAQYRNSGTARALDTMTLNFRYDTATRSIYAGESIIVDLDDPFYESGTLWGGFNKYGLVRLSLYADYYEKSSANFCITKIRGYDLNESTPNELFEDDVPPAIEIDSSFTKMPFAKVNSAYTVPSASAIDLAGGSCSLSTYVYYNYASLNSAVMININDGKFTPTRVGDYAIVYEAKGSNGAVGREVLWVEAKEDLVAPSISIPESGRKTSGVLGEWITVPEPQATSAEGIHTVTVTATNGATVYTVVDGGFRPEVEGTYTVKASITDYAGQTAESGIYTVEITRGTKPVFAETPDLPKYFISGYGYTVPEYYARDYTSGSLVYKITTMQLSDKNGSKTYEAGDTYVPEVDKNGDTATVTFKCGDTVSEPYVIPAIIAFENSELQIKNYFITSGAAATTDTTGTTVEAKSASGGFTFANPQLADKFNVTLRGVKSASNYSALRIVLTDTYDSSCSIEARLINGADTVFRAEKTDIIVTDGLKTGMDITIGYTNGSITLGNNAVAIDATVNGKPFGGFRSNKLYLSIYFEGASVGDRIVVTDISNQPTTNTVRDKIVPKIVKLGNYGGMYEVGNVVTLPAAVAGDVLTPDVIFTISVTSPSGAFVKAEDGTMLNKADPTKEYTIMLSEFGTYKVTYVATDTNEMLPFSDTYLITSEETQAPVISVLSNMKSTAKVGDYLTLPDFTVYDNVSDENDIIVIKSVITPTGDFRHLSGSSKTVQATQVGVYEFRVLAVDKAGNSTTVKFTVTVSAK